MKQLLTNPYLACYTFTGTGAKYGTGDYTFTVPALTPEAVSELRRILQDRLREEGVRCASVTFTSIIQLNAPTA